MKCSSLLACLCVLVSHLALGAELEAPPREPIAFEHAMVIDVAGGSVLADRSVVISGGRINGVGPAGAVAIPAGARVVDAAGKYLIPGLWDMHVHFHVKSYGALFVANGVTGVRVIWGNPGIMGMGFGPRYHDNWRTAFSEGKSVGPRMVIASGLVDGPNPIWPGSVVVRNAAECREAVRAAKKAGADFVKVYELIPTEAYFAIAAEAKALGIPFAGHVPQQVTAAQASDAGQKSMEHLYSIRSGCSTREDELMKKRAEALKDSKGLATLRAVVESEREVIRSTFSREKADALFARFKKNGTWQCPTLNVLHSIAWIDDPALANDPRLNYVAPFIRAFWNPKNDFRFKAMKPADFARMKEEFKRSLELVGAMRRAGVEFLAGTDEMNPYCFPGFSLHDELVLLVEAELTPLESLRTATINPARYLGREKDLGTIEAGKAADLVLLDANPLADIRNTTRIRAVVADGRLYDRAALDRILESSAADQAAAKPHEAASASGPPK